MISTNNVHQEIIYLQFFNILPLFFTNNPSMLLINILIHSDSLFTNKAINHIPENRKSWMLQKSCWWNKIILEVRFLSLKWKELAYIPEVLFCICKLHTFREIGYLRSFIGLWDPLNTIFTLKYHEQALWKFRRSIFFKCVGNKKQERISLKPLFFVFNVIINQAIWSSSLKDCSSFYTHIFWKE